MIKLGCYISLFFTLASCVIEDDIPYPVVDGAILSMEVEGQRGWRGRTKCRGYDQ